MHFIDYSSTIIVYVFLHVQIIVASLGNIMTQFDNYRNQSQGIHIFTEAGIKEKSIVFSEIWCLLLVACKIHASSLVVIWNVILKCQIFIHFWYCVLSPPSMSNMKQNPPASVLGDKIYFNWELKCGQQAAGLNLKLSLSYSRLTV